MHTDEIQEAENCVVGWMGDRVCIVHCVLWVRSYSWNDGFSDAISLTFGLDAGRGKVEFMVSMEELYDDDRSGLVGT